MRNYKFFSVILLFCVIFSCMIPAYGAEMIHEQESVPEPPELQLDVYGAILLDADSGDTIFTYHADEMLYPASTTKLMTAYLTMKYGDPYGWITVPGGIYAGMSDDASNAGLKAGEEMYVYELLQCLMIVSANEAANALAIYISGSVEAFVELMNEEAKLLGCENTHFVNTNGLHDPDHYTTARDLSKIALAAAQYDLLLDICGATEVTLRETNLSEERTLKTTNYLIPGNEYPGYGYLGTYGLKTGFTTPAGCCLAAICYRDGMNVLSVVLGAQKTKTDTETIVGSFTETQKLLDWGFENYEAGIQYQKYLESLPNATPEPSPEPTPEPTTDPTPSPVPSPELTPELSPTAIPSAAPSDEPDETPLPSPSPLRSEQIKSNESTFSDYVIDAAEEFGISVQSLLLIILGAAALLLILVLIILIRILMRPKKER